MHISMRPRIDAGIDDAEHKGRAIAEHAYESGCADDVHEMHENARTRSMGGPINRKRLHSLKTGIPLPRAARLFFHGYDLSGSKANWPFRR